jgi:ATP-binding cassette, subfamily B, bacterial
LSFRQNYAATTRGVLASLRLPNHAYRLLGISLLQSLLSTASWLLIGVMALNGHAEFGRLLGWGLLSFTILAVQYVTTQYVGRFTVRAATRLRMRLLEGALNLEADELSDFGLGGLMVISTQADRFLSSVVSLFLGALTLLSSLVSTLAVLLNAPQPQASLSIFGAFFLAACLLAWPIVQGSLVQQSEKVRLTTDMVERMLGHRTRLVQQTSKSWHEGEDESLTRYVAKTRAFDLLIVLLQMVPRGYFLCSLAVVFLVLVRTPTQESLALVLGGISLGMATLFAAIDFVLAGGKLFSEWKSIAPVLRESTLKRKIPRLETEHTSQRQELLEVRSLSFAYQNRKPVFENANLQVMRGERVLIEGPSGGGKTTLAALLSGIQKPTSGLVLVRGVDHHSVGEVDFRRTVASAPQFYKNHVFSGPLALNLLLGRRWPPTKDDLRDATAICTELGLGPLLDKMPAGLYQHVGATGWQLSHGEKSRVYLARTILQGSDVAILDETFGALDPATLNECLRTTLRHCPTLVVITHR